MSSRTVRGFQRWPGALLAVVLAAVGAIEAEAQTGQISGRVTNSASGEGVSAAIVSVQGTQLQTLSGADGSFAIPNVPVGNQTLITQRIGYQPLTRTDVAVSAGQPTVVNLALSEQALQLDAIVATGLVDPVSGRTSPITVGRVDRTNMPNVVAGSPLQNLQGQVAGVTVVSGSGEPGSNVSIQLRSPTLIGGGGFNTEPLIVVDGVILGANTVNLESMDIVSMEVVKGAAAASLYGSRANNGVISITTNRGTGLAVGQTQFSVRSEYGWQTPSGGFSRNESHDYLMNAEGTAYICNTTCGVLLLPPGSEVPRENRERRSQVDATTFWDQKFPGQTFDNLGGIWKPGSFQQHTVSLSQNAVDTNFFLSLNRNVQGGALPGNDGYNRNSFRLNLDHRFLDALSLSLSTFHSISTQDDVAGGFGDLVEIPVDIDATSRPLTAADSAHSFCGVVSCRYNRQPDPFQGDNVLWLANVSDNKDREARTQGSASLRWEPTAWLNLSGSVSYDRQDSKSTDYTPYLGLDLTDLTLDDGSLSFSQSISNAWNADIQAQVRRDFSGVNTRVTVRGSMERSRDESISATGGGFVFPDLFTLAAMPQASRSGSNSQSEIRANGFLVDGAFDYQGKYIATALVRRDGSSLFGRDARWRTYYRVAGNWRISEEEWFTLPLDELSLRVSRGTAGGRPGFSQQYEVWDLSGDALATKSQLGNREIRPSHTTEHDVTVQAVVGRWEVLGTYAWQRTDDQLRQVPLPAYLGYPNQWTNLGALAGSSLELTVSGPILQTDNFQWNTTVVADRSQAEIVEWPLPLICSETTDYAFRCKGIGVYEIWGYEFIDSRSGFESHRAGALVADPAIESQFDRNDEGLYVWVGDGVDYRDGAGPDGELRTGDDLWGTSTTIAGDVYRWGIPIERAGAPGSSQPIFQIGDARHVNLGWINNFRFGNFTFFAQMGAKIGGDVANTGFQGDAIPPVGSEGSGAPSPFTDQRGRPTGLKKPLLYYQTLSNSTQSSSYFVETSSYVKLRQLSVNYQLQPTQLARFGLSNAGITGLRLGVIGRNLYTWSDFSGWDPEPGLNLSGGTQTTNNSQYPPLRSYTVEFQVTF